MREPINTTGFTAPANRPLGQERGAAMLAELAAIACLTISTIVVATVISVGAARASVADGVIGNEGSVFAIALLLGLIFIGISGISLLPPSNRRHKH